jgi:hypothetical protein
MAERPEPPSHYSGLSLSSVSRQQRKEDLAKLMRERLEHDEALRAERQKRTDERHEIFMKGFRESISRDDRFTEEEKAEIIKASYEW